MQHAVLVYEPDTRTDLDTYVAGLRREVPSVQVHGAGSIADALAAAANASVLIAKAQNVPLELVSAMPRLRWIQALTTGIDPLLKLTLPPGTLITSARGIHGPQMAELTLLLMLALARRFGRMLDNQRASRWEKWAQPLLDGRTVVIVGVGAIAEALAARCRPFGLRIIGVSGRTGAPGFDEIMPRARLAEGAASADFLVLVVPYSPATHHLVDAAVLRSMKPTAFLINVARGSVIDEAALIDALQRHRIAGAGLDVFETEPLPAASPLWAMDNVIITPHIGGMSDTYAEQVLPVLAGNLRAFIANRLAELRNQVQLER